jgi:hypothetical protein
MLKKLLITLFLSLSFLYQGAYADASFFSGKLNVSSTQDSINLNWKPARDAAGNFYNYTIEYREAYLQNGPFIFFAEVSGSNNDISATITSLKSSTSYNIRITPKDLYGTIFPSELLLFTTLSTSRISLAIDSFSPTAITFEWKNLNTTVNNSTVVSYSLEYRKATGNNSFVTYNQTQISSTTDSLSVTNLIPGVLYEYRIVGFDKAGNQISVSNSVVAPFGNLPSLPIFGSVSYNESLGEVAATWNVDTKDLLYSNRPTSYIVEYRKDGSSWVPTSLKNSGELTVRLPLKASLDTLYEFRLFSKNDAGTNGPTSILSVKTPKTTSVAKTPSQSSPSSSTTISSSPSTQSTTRLTSPGVPGTVSVKPEDGSAIVSLVPGLSGTSPITSYEVSFKESSSSSWQKLNLTPEIRSGEVFLSVPKLQNSVSYDIKVAAVNSKGVGEYSKVFMLTPTSKKNEIQKICTPVITSYIKLNSKTNDKENVRRLQTFLRDYMGYPARVTGNYGLETFALVKRFQETYKEDVLSPWGLSKGSGWVYITTKKKINDLYCL